MSAGVNDDRVGEELVLLAAYLLSSGRGLLEEPAAYGPLRCLDAARRVLSLRSRIGVADSPELTDLRARMDDVMCGAMADRELDVLLDELCDRLAAALEEPGAVSA
ncbi:MULTISPECIES: DUF6092 family protein [unclassified Nocardiopsis]|jgi:hypothetical protein|uniref:DUF6092 family protein n=1 Tax=unclassified Nocardiopsis TaxID=2649073 RepID=UPI00066A2604|nr:MULTISPECIES: DUF6092 family protein [unclassified Nocardiopsis]MBQ1082307.1 hypothetical protein [Nocardiopsis sp. B62]